MPDPAQRRREAATRGAGSGSAKRWPRLGWLLMGARRRKARRRAMHFGVRPGAPRRFALLRRIRHLRAQSSASSRSSPGRRPRMRHPRRQSHDALAVRCGFRLLRARGVASAGSDPVMRCRGSDAAGTGSDPKLTPHHGRRTAVSDPVSVSLRSQTRVQTPPRAILRFITVQPRPPATYATPTAAIA